MGGKSLRDQPPHRRLGAAVGLGDGIEDAAARLVLRADRAAEKRENHFARHLRKSVDEGGKVDGGHAKSPQSAIKVMPKSHICHPDMFAGSTFAELSISLQVIVYNDYFSW